MSHRYGHGLDLAYEYPMCCRLAVCRVRIVATLPIRPYCTFTRYHAEKSIEDTSYSKVPRNPGLFLESAMTLRIKHKGLPSVRGKLSAAHL